MRTLTWFLFLALWASCGRAFMFSSLRDPVKEPQGKVPCGGHFRVRHGLPERAPGWLGSRWLWLFFVVLLYVMLRFRGENEKRKVRTAPLSSRRLWAHLRNFRLGDTDVAVGVGRCECKESGHKVATSWFWGALANPFPDASLGTATSLTPQRRGLAVRDNVLLPG